MGSHGVWEGLSQRTHRILAEELDYLSVSGAQCSQEADRLHVISLLEDLYGMTTVSDNRLRLVKRTMLRQLGTESLDFGDVAACFVPSLWTWWSVRTTLVVKPHGTHSVKLRWPSFRSQRCSKFAAWRNVRKVLHRGQNPKQESLGALSISNEEERLLVRYTSEGTQSQESKKEKRWWERWR